MLGPAAHRHFDPASLHLGSELRCGRLNPRRSGWHQVRTGVWLPADAHAVVEPVDRYAALVHATALMHRQGMDLTFARESAAAVLGMPRISPWPQTVSHLVTRLGISSRTLLRPVLGCEAETVRVHGIQVTAPARTVIDLARFATLEDAVTAADYILRHGLCTRDDFADELAAVPTRARGRAQATMVVQFADGLSMSPGESLSRVQMFRLRIPRPRLQVPLWDEDGHIGDADFGWEGVVGEFDGRTKYRVPEGASADQASRALWAEKKREDRLRRKAALARWVWADVLRPERLLSILMAQGITREPRSTWFDLDHESGAA